MVEPTKKEAYINMDYSDSDRKVPATKKQPSRSAKKRVVYFDKSDWELESNEDGDEASKTRSFKKIANTEPDLLHLPGTSKSTQLYTSRSLAPVTNSLPQKKKLWSSQCQSSSKENRVSDVKMGSKAATALSFERGVPGNVSISAAVMKIFLMSQNSFDLEKPTKT